MYPGAMGGMPPTGPGQHGMGHPSPMNSPMQQQKRIDPDQMPSPVSIFLCCYGVERHHDRISDFRNCLEVYKTRTNTLMMSK